MSPKDCAYIVERLAVRFMSMVAEYERKLLEHRDAFGVRTSADAKIIEGLRQQIETLNREERAAYDTLEPLVDRVVKERDGLLTQVQDQRAEIERLRAEVADLRGIVDMVHASLGIKRGDHIGNAIAQLKAQTPKRSHPVAVGEYLRRLTGFSTTPAGEVAQVLHVDCDAPTTEYTVKRPNGQQGVWSESGCEPCDPPGSTHADPDLTQLHAKGKEAWSDVPNATQWVEDMRGNTEASHDTTAGKEAAEAVVRDSQMTEIKVGDVVEVVSASGGQTWMADVGSTGKVRRFEGIECVRLQNLPGKRNALGGYVSLCDVRKVPQ